MKSVILVSLIAVLLTGCAAKKEMVPVGGSKADGTVRMGFTYGSFEKPVVNLTQAKDLASQKCKVWGYEGAEAFGGQVTSCGQPDGWGGCSVTNVAVEYQCVGGKASQN